MKASRKTKFHEGEFFTLIQSFGVLAFQITQTPHTTQAVLVKINSCWAAQDSFGTRAGGLSVAFNTKDSCVDEASQASSCSSSQDFPRELWIKRLTSLKLEQFASSRRRSFVELQAPKQTRRHVSRRVLIFMHTSIGNLL